MGIFKFGNNTYPRCIRRRLNLGHIFREKKVRLMGQEIWYFGNVGASMKTLDFSDGKCSTSKEYVTELT